MAKKSGTNSTARGRKNDVAGKALVVVESPAKAKTINKYLGSGYVVRASMGHVRDLPKNDLGIDLTNGFAPVYESLPTRTKILAELREAARGASEIYLATDLDREGEAIAWHLVEALKLPKEKIRRVIFNEITKSAITQAFENPHDIDLDKVNAQQARRILDRIMGYQLSPLLWRKIAKGLSAGRVQSVTVRMVVERERQIRAFIPEEYWRIMGSFSLDPLRAGELADEWRRFVAAADEPDGPTEKDRLAWSAEHHCLRAELVEVGGGEFKPRDIAEARKVAEALGFVVSEEQGEPWPDYARLDLHRRRLIGRTVPEQAPAYRIASVATKRTTSRPPAPFTTAALQQAGSNRLRFSASRTMRIAQQLYEGVDIGNGEGPVGLITYMRTDSTNLSNDSIEAVRAWISQHQGPEYLPDKPNRYGSSQRAQEAHEAIRPTDPAFTPESLEGRLTAEQYKLYDLIWRRFVACQMPPAQWDSTTVMIEADSAAGLAKFKATGRRLVFDGFLKVAGAPSSGGEQLLPDLAQDQPLAPVAIEPTQCFTSPPPRYTEASLVKALEAEGIGRPSTYAAIIQTIQDKGYCEQHERRFHATPLGEVVTDKLVQHFPDIMDIKFTSHMEDDLDKIENSHMDWVEVLEEFYEPFSVDLVKAGQEMETAKAEPSDHKCPKCDSPMVYRWSKSGRFLSCAAYPECKTTQDVDIDGNPVKVVVSDVACGKCGAQMVLRRSRNGPFLGCTRYPECDQTLPCDESGQPLKLVKEGDIKEKCDDCGSPMAVKWRGRRAFLGCTAYPNCRTTKSLPPGIYLEPPPKEPPEPAGFNCEKCGRAMVIRTGRRGKFISCSGFPRCRNAKPIDKLEELKAAAAQAPDQPTTPGAVADAPAKPAKTNGNKTNHAHLSDGPIEAGAVPNNEGNPGVRMTKAGKLAIDSLDRSVNCPNCGAEMTLKRGPWGPFLSCSAYPKCSTTGRLNKKAREQAEEQLPPVAPKPKPRPTDIDCDQCGAKMVIRTGRTGEFLSCSAFPKCRNAKPLPAELVGRANNGG
ncbi:MAG: type I DNA topoisomerase [Phycisphaerae bacterium]|nr:type I DNA topoisomerase [Phycisphaerae bacterium]